MKNKIRNIYKGIMTVAVLLFCTNTFAGTTVTYLHNDLLGSPVASSDNKGNILWRQHYLPFGAESENIGSQADNDINYTGHQRDDENDLVYMQARYYDPVIGRFYSNDPVGFSNVHNFNRYAYANNNPYKYVDPDGNSPISYLAKQVAKHGVKEGMQRMANRQMRRMGRYMNKGQAKDFASDVADILGSLDSSPLEIAIEMIPVAGDIYGGAKFTKQVSSAFGKLQDLENKYADKIISSLPPAQRKKFITAMRNAGVRDAKQDRGMPKTGSGMEMHHKEFVRDSPEMASDPRNIVPLTPAQHRIEHQ